MRVSVIIPTISRAAEIAQALDSLFAALKNESAESFEVIVVSNLVDNQTELALRPWLQEYKNLQYFCTRKIGVNIARNAGVQRARGDIVLFLDDDCRVHSADFLERHRKIHRAFPNVAAVGGPYVCPRSSNVWTMAYARIARAWLEGARYESPFTSQLIGGNTSYKRALFHEYQFDPSIRFGGSETELNQRLERAGWSLVFEPSLSVRHENQLSLTGFLFRAWAQGSSKKRIDLERLGPQTLFLWDQLDWNARYQRLEEFGFPLPNLGEHVAIKMYEYTFQLAGIWTQAKMMEHKLKPRLKVCWRSLKVILSLSLPAREIVRTCAVSYRAYRMRHRKPPEVA